MLDKIEDEENKDNDDKKDYGYYINRYNTVDPIWIVPYYRNYPWWDRVTF